MGYQNRGGYGGGGGYRGGNGGGGGGGFTPKPGSGTLFFKQDKRNNSNPDYDGYFIVEFDVRAGEKIKLVGWDKQTAKGPMINLKMGRERQDAPGYDNGGQGGYQQPPPQNRVYQAPLQIQPGSYHGGAPAGQPAQTYQPPAAGPHPGPAGAPPAAGVPGPKYTFPPPAEGDLPF